MTRPLMRASTAAWISVWAPVPVIVIIAPATNTQGRARKNASVAAKARIASDMIRVQTRFVARINSRAQSAPRSDSLREANVLRPAQLEHAVQRGGSNGHLGRLPASGPWAQRVADHALVATDIGLHQGTPIVSRCPLPAHATAP